MPDDQSSGGLATRASLLGRLRDWNNSESWDEFARQYSRLIRSVALQAGLNDAEAKDVEQETLLAVARHIHEFEVNPERGSFKAWLLTIVRSRMTDQFRRRQVEEARRHSPSTEPREDRTATVERVADAQTIDQIWERQWQHTLINLASERVCHDASPKHAQIFDLYTVQQQRAGEVAEALGVSLMTVYLVNHRLGRRFRREIERLKEEL